MTDSFPLSSENDPALNCPPSISEALPNENRPIDVKLPPEVAAAIAQRMEQSGQTQAQVILEALQIALRQDPSSLPPAQISVAQPDELQSLQQRVALLETLIPRLAVLEGKSIAF
ncbi:hypothetical protein IFO70_16865 [Phormidium tenue FACHB-886]|nr:hypothetical protein [Phormidium tenue FACHB-886]